MTGRTRAQSLAASPTMVGAITTLIVIVAVFLAYNANNGLPFVPVYRVSAEMCNAARLGPNNEVRIGGNRVGVVESIETVQLEDASGCQTPDGASATAAAKLNLKLDESARGLPEDSTIRVRYRSSFGLKFLEIVRGNGEELPEGATLPVEQSEQQVEFDDIGNTFDTPTRESSRRTLEGFGNAFAARGASLNQAIESLNPLFTNLRPVAKALTEPATQFEQFFPALANTARIVAPVAADNAEFFTNAAIAFGAISSDPEALRDTISEGHPLFEEGIQSLPIQYPFLRDFAAFSRLLRPGVRDLRASLPVLNSTVSIGAEVLPRTVQMNNDLEDVFVELEELVDEPSTTRSGQKATKVALERLGTFFDEATGLSGAVAPYQTVCNYWNHWFTYLTEHITEEDQVGFAQRVALVGTPGATSPPPEWPRNPLDNYAGGSADGRHSSLGPTPGLFDPSTQPILHANPYGPSGTASAPNCQPGQTGYVLGNFPSPGQRPQDPAFGVRDISAATGIPKLGQSDVFWFKNGTRTFAAP
jgi:ABC-type transporter Mla subunit MlaD